MLTRIIYLTLRYYFVTLIALVLFYLIFVAYYHVNETLLFVFTVLLAWLQPVIDKVREIKRQVELETPRARVREVAIQNAPAATFHTRERPTQRPWKGPRN